MALSRDLADKLTNTLMDLFVEGVAPTRKQIVDRIKQGEDQPNPSLDLDVARCLNHLVDLDMFRRFSVNGQQVYVPNPNGGNHEGDD